MFKVFGVFTSLIDIFFSRAAICFKDCGRHRLLVCIDDFLATASTSSWFIKVCSVEALAQRRPRAMLTVRRGGCRRKKLSALPRRLHGGDSSTSVITHDVLMTPIIEPVPRGRNSRQSISTSWRNEKSSNARGMCAKFHVFLRLRAFDPLFNDFFAVYVDSQRLII